MRIYRAAAIARTRWLRPSVCVVRGLGCSVTCIPTFAMIPERASSIAWRCAACSATSADTALPRDCRERRDCEDAAVPRDCRERRDFGEWRELCADEQTAATSPVPVALMASAWAVAAQPYPKIPTLYFFIRIVNCGESYS